VCFGSRCSVSEAQERGDMVNVVATRALVRRARSMALFAFFSEKKWGLRGGEGGGERREI